jgi:hypothetical protein
MTRATGQRRELRVHWNGDNQCFCAMAFCSDCGRYLGCVRFKGGEWMWSAWGVGDRNEVGHVTSHAKDRSALVAAVRRMAGDRG